MKKMSLLVVFFIPLSMMAQKTPAAVTAAFAKRFPEVKNAKFEKEKNGEYEANFKKNGIIMSANFTESGDWRATETAIPTTELPQVVATSIKSSFPKAKLVGAAKIETADKGLQYEADLQTGLKKSEVFFDVQGHVIK